MTPARLMFEGRHYPEHPEEPFAETAYRTDGPSLTVPTLSFLWEAAALKEICQARLAGIRAQGKEIRPKKRMTLHESDFCSVYAFLGSHSMMTIEVVEKVIEFEGKKYPVLSQGCRGPHWAAHPITPSFGSLVKAKQLPASVRVMGTFVKVHDGELVTNLIYALRQTDEPHPSEEKLRADIERVRKGGRLPWFAPRVAVGTVFGREVELLEGA